MSAMKLGSKISIVVMSLFLFVVISAISYRASGLELSFGWRVEKTTYQSTDGQNLLPIYAPGVCDRALVIRGFPFVTTMPSDDESDCNDQYNITANILNILVALVVSIGITWFVVMAFLKKQPSRTRT